VEELMEEDNVKQTTEIPQENNVERRTKTLQENDVEKQANPTRENDVEDNEQDNSKIELQQEKNKIPDKAKSAAETKEDWVKQYKQGRNLESGADGENDSNIVEQMRQAEVNWGMQFSGSHIDKATFIIDNNRQSVPPKITNDVTVNLLGEKDEGIFLQWCVAHYTDFYFSVLLAACILDRQTYQTIYQMAKELQEILSESAKESEEEKKEWISKSQLAKTLGIIPYSDITLVRGIESTVDFLRLPVHEQAEYIICLLINEFSELKCLLSRYLINKITQIYGSKHNYIVISGCMEALSYIGLADLQFFNDQIIPSFLHKRKISMDYCVAVLLGKLYRKDKFKEYVQTCVVQWGQLKNNPDNLLVSLYVCSMLGNQEYLVCDIWMNVLDELIKEFLTGNYLGSISHIERLQGLFKSGNRNISYYKGVIHAFYKKMQQVEQHWDRYKISFLNTIFFLFLFEDYASSSVSRRQANRRTMIFIHIFQKLDEKTGKELTALWCRVLQSKENTKECWKLLEDYLKNFEDYNDLDIEMLGFFFYHINCKMGDNQAIYFLKECVKENGQTIPLARQIYKLIKE